MTYIVDQYKNVIRYRFEEAVASFCAGTNFAILMHANCLKLSLVLCFSYVCTREVI